MREKTAGGQHRTRLAQPQGIVTAPSASTHNSPFMTTLLHPSFRHSFSRKTCQLEVCNQRDAADHERGAECPTRVQGMLLHAEQPEMVDREAGEQMAVMVTPLTGPAPSWISISSATPRPRR